MDIEQKIEALLFYKNEPVEIKKISSILGIGEKQTREALKKLSDSMVGRGVCLIVSDDEAALATAPEAKELIEGVAKDEMSRDIGKAGLETLAIVLYNGPLSRREVDYIRGVNSAFILRNLCTRGLIKKEQDAKDQRMFKYRGSLELLAHLGIRNVEELPEFDMFKKSIASAMETRDPSEAAE